MLGRATATPGLTSRLVARNAIRLLDLADQLFTLPFDFHVRVARTLSPLLLESPRQLFEITAHSIQIHRHFPRRSSMLPRNAQRLIAAQHACQNDFRERNQDGTVPGITRFLGRAVIPASGRQPLLPRYIFCLASLASS